MAVGSRNRSATMKLIKKQRATVSGADNLADICPHEARHRSRGRKMNELFPHSLTDVGNREDLHAFRGFEQRR